MSLALKADSRDTAWVPFPVPDSGNSAGGFAALGAVVGPLMMLFIALQKPGPVRTLMRAEADCPERARKASTLGLTEPPLAPLLRAGVVVRETDGRIWVDRGKARRRQWRIALWFGVAIVAISGMVAFALAR
ncbi:MAG: hypothetical protein QM516_05020 [Limnohabitans sp.]|nr:hypothetical protein [Limnohabitans sp.]